MTAILDELLLVLAGHSSTLFAVVPRPGPSHVPHAPWSWSLRTTVAATALVHPGEQAMLNALADMAAKYRRVTTFAASVRDRARNQVLHIAHLRRKPHDWQIPMLTHVAARMLTLLKPYQQLVLETERDIMQRSWDMVAFSSHDSSVSLINIRARFEEWNAPLDALDSLVSALLQGPPGSIPTFLGKVKTGTILYDPTPPPACPRWRPGQLLDTVSLRREQSVGRVHACMSALLSTAEDVWRQDLVLWMCSGVAKVDADVVFNTSDDPLVERSGNMNPQAEAESLTASVAASSALPPLVTARNEEDELTLRHTGWQFATNALPSWIAADADLVDAMLYTGRALAKVREHARKTSGSAEWDGGYGSTSNGLPAALVASHTQLLLSDEARPCSHRFDFQKAVKRVRDEVSEWMWRNILTSKVVLDAFQTLGDYFLQRNGLFVTALLERLTDLRKAKLISARSAAAGLIRSADLELAIQRALIDVDADEDSRLLEHGSVIMPHMDVGQRKEGEWNQAVPSVGMQPARFDDVAIGVPFILRYRAPFPLDLILTPLELRAYSSVFSYLLALQAVRARLRDGWKDVSKAQRDRRRFTGTGDGGGDRQEVLKRKHLLRMACGTAREGLWLLDVLAGHFQTDIIDVQYGKLLDQLDKLRPPEEEEEVVVNVARVSTSSSASVMSSVDGWRQKVGDTVRRVSSLSALREERGDDDDEGDDDDDDEASDDDASDVRLRARASTPAATTSEPLSRRLARMAIARRLHAIPLPAHAQVQASALRQASTARSYTEAVGSTKGAQAKPAATLDFATLRATHQTFLADVVEGLLLTNGDACHCILRILQTCVRFAALLERWGGDVLPELLSEGCMSGNNDPGRVRHDLLHDRITQIAEVADALRHHLDAFFKVLNRASTAPPVASSDDSMHAAHPQRSGQADGAASRHHEQLLLRLDFNGFISRRFADAAAKPNASLATGGDQSDLP